MNKLSRSSISTSGVTLKKPAIAGIGAARLQSQGIVISSPNARGPIGSLEGTASQCNLDVRVFPTLFPLQSYLQARYLDAELVTIPVFAIVDHHEGTIHCVRYEVIKDNVEGIDRYATQIDRRDVYLGIIGVANLVALIVFDRDRKRVDWILEQLA